MFRIRILSAWVIMTMLFSACADWVNVSPKDEIEGGNGRNSGREG